MKYKEYLGHNYVVLDLDDSYDFARRKGLAQRKNWGDLAITIYLEEIIATYGRFCVPDMFIYEIKKRFDEQDYRLKNLTVYVNPSVTKLI